MLHTLQLIHFSSFERNRDGGADRDGPRERPRLNLKPRSKPVENSSPAPAPESGKQAGNDADNFFTQKGEKVMGL